MSCPPHLNTLGPNTIESETLVILFSSVILTEKNVTYVYVCICTPVLFWIDVVYVLEVSHQHQWCYSVHKCIGPYPSIGPLCGGVHRGTSGGCSCYEEWSGVWPSTCHCPQLPLLLMVRKCGLNRGFFTHLPVVQLCCLLLYLVSEIQAVPSVCVQAQYIIIVQCQ